MSASSLIFLFPFVADCIFLSPTVTLHHPLPSSPLNYHCISTSHPPPLTAVPFLFYPPPVQIALPSLRAVSLLRALRPRRVLHVPLPREEPTREPPPLHHGEGRVRKLGPDPQRPLLPAGLEARRREYQRERCFRFSFSGRILSSSGDGRSETCVCLCCRVHLPLLRLIRTNETAVRRDMLQL